MLKSNLWKQKQSSCVSIIIHQMYLKGGRHWGKKKSKGQKQPGNVGIFIKSLRPKGWPCCKKWTTASLFSNDLKLFYGNSHLKYELSGSISEIYRSVFVLQTPDIPAVGPTPPAAVCGGEVLGDPDGWIQGWCSRRTKWKNALLSMLYWPKQDVWPAKRSPES